VSESSKGPQGSDHESRRCIHSNDPAELMKRVHRTQEVSVELRALENAVRAQLLPQKHGPGGYAVSPVCTPTVDARIVFVVLLHIRRIESRRRHHAADALPRAVREERRGATADIFRKAFEEYRP
jgi:hypothetical protein